MTTILAPVVSDFGIVAPTYAEILAYLQDTMRSIYGSDIYIEPDSQDGQWLATLATIINDNNMAIIAAYNSFSPATAQGVGLSSVIKINGMLRLVASNSQAVVRITGEVGIEIVNGQIASSIDQQQRWLLPFSVIIPIAGFIDVTATAVDEGNIVASPGILTVIVTPTRGWQSVTNPAAATPGNPVESDATLRRRQSVSTSIPALSVIDAILGAIRNLANVGRAYIYENKTGAVDANGVPGHTISCVVENGDTLEIAQTIALYKTPGTGTYGTTTETVTDVMGIPSDISFYVLALSELFVLANITAEAGYVTTTADAIKASVVQWLNNIAIGADSFITKLWSPINLTGDSATVATGQTQGQLDILGDTYDATSLYQALADMVIVGGPYVAGVFVVNITNTGDLAIGKRVALVLDDTSVLYTTITNKVGTAITMLNAIPALRSAINGALMYVDGNVTIPFNKAADCAVAQVRVDVT